MIKLVTISGEEEFLVERAVEDEIASSLCGETIEFDMSDSATSYASDATLSVFNSDPRVVIIRNCNSIPDLPESDNLVIAVSPIGKKRIDDPRSIRSHNFPKLKSYDDNNEVVKWILKEGNRFNIDLSRVAGALFVNSGNRLRKLASEVEKLSLVCPKYSVVTPDDARSTLCFSADLTPKEIIDAVSSGNPGKAMSYYDKLQEQGDETGWIIAYMFHHVLNVLRASLITDKNVIHDVLGVHPFVVKKTILPLVNKWTVNSLRKSSMALSDADILNKSGSQRAKMILESEILRLSTEVSI